MTTAIIANPRAGAGKVGRHWPRFERTIVKHFDKTAILLTKAPGQSTELVRQALKHGAERIVVLGGDGTFNEAVNGLVDPKTNALVSNCPPMMFLPVGTASDFSRSTGMTGLSLDDILASGTPRQIDLGRLELTGINNAPAVHYFINIASFGATALIVHRVNRSTKRFGGKVAFIKGTLEGLASWRDRRVRIQVDDGVDEECAISAVALANGRYFGGGMMVAPQARVSDGLIDVVLIKTANVLKFIKYGGKLYKGRHLDLPIFSLYRGRRITIQPADDRPAPILVETDGETPGYVPLICEVQPEALTMIAPWHRAEAV